MLRAGLLSHVSPRLSMMQVSTLLECKSSSVLAFYRVLKGVSIIFYALNHGIYLVKGAVRGCIYDFNSSKLYSLNKALADKIDLVNQGIVESDQIDLELQEVFGRLMREEILILSETPITNQIEEIKSKDTACKFAWVEITNQCNLRCRHCYNESESQSTSVMTLDHYKTVIDKLLDLGVSRIQLIGGEPFFDRNRLKDMLDYTIGKFSFIEIFTNGTLIDPSWMEYLSANNIHIALSVYSYQENMHDQVTGHVGSFFKTTNTIAALKSHCIPYRVCNVLMEGIDLGEKDTELFELSQEKDVVRMSGRASFSLLSDELIRKKLITKKSFEVPISRPFASRLLSGHNCFRDRIYISATMDVFPCVMERRLKHCTICADQEIELDDAIRSMNKDKIHTCAQCEYRYACFDCRPNSLSGDLLEKPWYCTYDPLTGRWADEGTFIEDLKKQWGTPTPYEAVAENQNSEPIRLDLR